MKTQKQQIAELEDRLNAALARIATLEARVVSLEMRQPQMIQGPGPALPHYPVRWYPPMMGEPLPKLPFEITCGATDPNMPTPGYRTTSAGKLA